MMGSIVADWPPFAHGPGTPTWTGWKEGRAARGESGGEGRMCYTSRNFNSFTICVVVLREE